MENNLDNDKLIHGDEKAPNQSQALPPLDEASCSASSLSAVAGGIKGGKLVFTNSTDNYLRGR